MLIHFSFDGFPATPFQREPLWVTNFSWPKVGYVCRIETLSTCLDIWVTLLVCWSRVLVIASRRRDSSSERAWYASPRFWASVTVVSRPWSFCDTSPLFSATRFVWVSTSRD